MVMTTAITADGNNLTANHCGVAGGVCLLRLAQVAAAVLHVVK
jgi:hypothetical protein